MGWGIARLVQTLHMQYPGVEFEVLTIVESQPLAYLTGAGLEGFPVAEEMFCSSPFRAARKSATDAEAVIRQMRLGEVVEPCPHALQMVTASSTERGPVVVLNVSVEMTNIQIGCVLFVAGEARYCWRCRESEIVEAWGMGPAMVPLHMVAPSLRAADHAHALGAWERLIEDPLLDMLCEVVS